jgi:hypothetical protein
MEKKTSGTKTDEARPMTLKEDSDVVFKGAYDYFHKGSLYSEETFFVSKFRRDESFLFNSEILTRLDSGELLKTTVVYHVNKDFVPFNVSITKLVGINRTEEKFNLEKKASTMNYEFLSENKNITGEIILTPRFQVATPNCSHKFLFIFSKKYDPTGRNFYNILTSENTWDFVEIPSMKTVSLERVSLSPISIKIRDKELRATQYRVTSFKEDQSKDIEQPITGYLSKHLHITSQIDAPGDIKIQIKYLQEMELDDDTIRI